MATELPRSPLLALPRELRDMIYSYACNTNGVWIEYGREVRVKPGPLTLVCKQLHQETLDFCCGHTTFRFACRPTALRFLTELDPYYRNLLQKVRYITGYRTAEEASAALGRFRCQLEKEGVKLRDGVVWAGATPQIRLPTYWVGMSSRDREVNRNWPKWPRYQRRDRNQNRNKPKRTRHRL